MSTGKGKRKSPKKPSPRRTRKTSLRLQVVLGLAEYLSLVPPESLCAEVKRVSREWQLSNLQKSQLLVRSYSKTWKAKPFKTTSKDCKPK